MKRSESLGCLINLKLFETLTHVFIHKTVGPGWRGAKCLGKPSHCKMSYLLGF